MAGSAGGRGTLTPVPPSRAMQAPATPSRAAHAPAAALLRGARNGCGCRPFASRALACRRWQGLIHEWQVWQATLLTVAADSHACAYVTNSRSKPHRHYSNFPLRCESIVGMHDSNISPNTRG